MPEDSRRWIQQHSAGGVVVRHSDGADQVLLIKPRNRNRWQLPKGTIDRGETPEVAAVREVREEGGVDARIITGLGPIKFFYQMHGQRYVKTVDFYLMEYEGGSIDDHDHEVDDARWIPLEEARRTLAFKTEQDLVERSLTWVRAHPRSAAS